VGGEISEQYAKCIIEQADARRPIRGADALGRYLRLSDKLRTELGIKTIGSFDVSKQQRARRRKEQRRAYDEKRRRMRGAKPHVQYAHEALGTRKDQPPDLVLQTKAEPSRCTEKRPILLIPVCTEKRPICFHRTVR
jgi:hypothetical protein